MPTFFERLQHSWNAFRGRDRPSGYTGPASYYRPDQIRLRVGNDRSLITAIYNRIAMDVASNKIEHVKLDLDNAEGPFTIEFTAGSPDDNNADGKRPDSVEVTLKNGTVLNGYIQSQNGSGKMTFHTDNAVVYMKSNNTNVYDFKVKIGNLDKAWKDWAEKNDAFQGLGSNRTLELSNISFKYDYTTADSVLVLDEDMGFEDELKEHNRQVSNVRILERGVNVKFLELTPNTYVISWNDIESIRADRRPKSALSGINRIYELKNGKTYEGEYAEETNDHLSLYLENGVVQSFKIDDVIKYTFRPINPNQDIFEQSPLIDIVRTKNGGQFRGVIIEQNYASKKDSES